MRLSGHKEKTDKWEKKYFSLLDEHDALEQSYQTNEQLLCKTITRLALASTGFNHALDPYLKRLRKQLKNGLKSNKLKQELEEFSNALLTLDESSNQTSKETPSLLIEFLIRHFPNKEADFHTLERAYHSDSKAGIQDLLLALHELVDEQQNVVTEIHSTHQDDEQIRELLYELLSDTDVPERFKKQTEQLSSALQHHEDSLPNLLNQTFSLLLAIKKHFQSEKQDMTQFLTHISEQLTVLGTQAADSSHSTQQFISEKQHLDQTINAKMAELHYDSANATELDILKNVVRERLNSISELLKNQQQKETTEQQNNLHSFQALLDKIRFLENETTSLHQKLHAAHYKALRDPLTSLPNRLAYDERLLVELAKKQRNQSALSLIVWDIDFFKKINDSYGHKAGDKTLTIIAKLLLNSCRQSDFVARFGGEEFLTLLPDTDAQSAFIIADKIRQNISSSGFNYQGHKIKITISCGISEFTNGDSGDTVFKRADTALYQAKRNGRNQCIIAPY